MISSPGVQNASRLVAGIGSDIINTASPANLWVNSRSLAADQFYAVKEQASTVATARGVLRQPTTPYHTVSNVQIIQNCNSLISSIAGWLQGRVFQSLICSGTDPATEMTVMLKNKL